MIYKIYGNYIELNIIELFNKNDVLIKSLFKKEAVYITLINIKDLRKFKNIVLKNIKNNKDYLVVEIDEKNIMREDKFIQEWCRDNFVILQKQKYELEQQEKLKLVMKALDDFENILINIGKEESECQKK